ncbi:MAG: hypothetical protein ACPIOQ_66000, partial [Promethearchaeia archaeon]
LPGGVAVGIRSSRAAVAKCKLQPAAEPRQDESVAPKNSSLKNSRQVANHEGFAAWTAGHDTADISTRSFATVAYLFASGGVIARACSRPTFAGVDGSRVHRVQRRACVRWHAALVP